MERPATGFGLFQHSGYGMAAGESAAGIEAAPTRASMNDIARLFQAFLAPAIFVSATGLLILSINVRLMGMVTRLRQYVHAKHDAAKNERLQEAEAYTEQINSIERRAETIRRCFLLVLVSLAGSIASCLLLGVGIYWIHAAVAAVIVFVLALICLFVGTVYYIREVMVALSSVQQEARDARFMDLGPPPEIRTRDPI
jgi:ABC-type transport system involved in cytochrome bd biosynthesis fused ATPase/permease subunit